MTHSEDGLRVQQLLDEFQQRFNPSCEPIGDRRSGIFENPHVEIKTQYLYGRDVELII